MTEESNVTIFPDTNILLHFRHFPEVDWCTVGKAKLVKLVFCLQIIDELDNKKRDLRLKERAQRVLKAIAESNGKTIREGVTVTVYQPPHAPEAVPNAADTGVADAVFLRQAKKYLSDHSLESGLVCSDDYGMRLRCEAVGVECVTLDPNWALPDPRDESQKEIQRLKNELDEVKSQLPELAVHAVAEGQPSGNDVFDTVLAPVHNARDIDALVAKEQTKYASFDANALNVRMSDRAWAIARFIGGPAAYYQKDVDEYLGAYRRYLKAVSEYEDLAPRTLRFDLLIGNSGGRPAEDVDMVISLPRRFLLVARSESKEARKLREPSPPVPPELPTGNLEEYLLRKQGEDDLRQRRMDYMGSRMPPLPDTGPRISVHDSGVAFTITIQVHRVKHHDQLRLGPFVATFRRWDDVGPFEAGYVIRMANHPQEKAGKLIFRARADGLPRS